MKFHRLLPALSLLVTVSNINAQENINPYNLPDSVKAVQFMAEITVNGASNNKKEAYAGIQTDEVKLRLESDKKEKNIEFSFPAGAPVMAQGLDTKKEKDEIEWKYDWAINKTYRLLISTTSDSAENFSLYSGYIWLPDEAKWKLIGTCKINGRWNTLTGPASIFSNGNKNKIDVKYGQVWVQRITGGWKNLNGNETTAPSAVVSNHIDSLTQAQLEKDLLEKDIASGKANLKPLQDGVYYEMIKEGRGQFVMVSDTVTVFYKGYLYSDGSVFDQTREKTATFPLKRLIRGWQLGLPLTKTGGKIKLVIPSGQAYSIRTRAAKIPPNSILVFEIEVVETKQAQ